MARARKYYVVDQAQRGLWYQVGHFSSKKAAERFRKTLDGQTRIVYTYPSGHDYPAKNPCAPCALAWTRVFG